MKRSLQKQHGFRSNHLFFNVGILFPNLTLCEKKNCSSHREKLLKFEAARKSEQNANLVNRLSLENSTLKKEGKYNHIMLVIPI